MEGVIYYNVGHKCLVRLSVSILTLRKHYTGPVTILSGNEGFEECKKIADYFNVDILLADFDSDREKNWVLLNKCRLHEKTPYEKTIFIDSDTVVLKDFSDVFDRLDRTDFVVTQFANWETAGRHYRKRLKRWKDKVSPLTYKGIFTEKRAVNIGFYGWAKGAEIFSDWYTLAKTGREGFIPDEMACQILLPGYQIEQDYDIIDSRYNTSCKFEKVTEDIKILHFHGRKHCRIEDGKYLYNSDFWYKYFDEIKDKDIVATNIQYDRMLLKNLHKRELCI